MKATCFDVEIRFILVLFQIVPSTGSVWMVLVPTSAVSI